MNTRILTVSLSSLLLLATIADSADAPPAAGAPAAATNVPTPRTADGRPDLNGVWGGGGFGFAGLGGGPQTGADAVLSAPLRNGDISNLTNDGVIQRRSGNNLPVYKPEHWDKVLQDDYDGNLLDTFNSCMPMSLPRMGPPVRIVQTPTDFIFIYTVPFQRNDFRIIPMGPRKHKLDRDGSWLGDPVARWDGDTLVVETEGFNDQTWLGPEGYIHGYELKITERFKRNGNTMDYDVTAEDPEFLSRPWVLQTRTLRLNTSPDYRLEESPPCSERDNKHLVGKNREM